MCLCVCVRFFPLLQESVTFWCTFCQFPWGKFLFPHHRKSQMILLIWFFHMKTTHSEVSVRFGWEKNVQSLQKHTYSDSLQELICTLWIRMSSSPQILTHSFVKRERDTPHPLSSISRVRVAAVPSNAADRQEAFTVLAVQHSANKCKKSTNGRKQPRTHNPLPANVANHSPRNTKCSLNVWCASGSTLIHCLLSEFQ